MEGVNAKKPSKKKRGLKYRYVVSVFETCEHETEVVSDKEIPWYKIEKIVEKRRLNGELKFVGVTEVASWVKEASVLRRRRGRVASRGQGGAS